MRRLEQMQVREVKRKAPFRSQAQAGSWCQDVPNKEHVIGIAERSCTYNIIYCTALPFLPGSQANGSNHNVPPCETLGPFASVESEEGMELQLRKG